MALSAMEIVLVNYGSGAPMDDLSDEQIVKFLSVLFPPGSRDKLTITNRDTGLDTSHQPAPFLLGLRHGSNLYSGLLTPPK